MRKIYSDQEINLLMQNPCVFNCTAKLLSYTFEFKRNALALNAIGLSPREIWMRSGFDVSKWRKDYFKDTIKDWNEIVKKHGIEGLSRLGGIQSDKGPDNTDSDKIKRLELQVKYLEAENSFLAKLRAKRAESNSGPAKNMESSDL